MVSFPITEQVHLTRRYRFSASHRLHNPLLLPEQNQEIYGKCNNPHGHGHNYFLEVTVSGPVDPRTGIIVDLAELDSLVQSQVLDRFDETSLNELANFESQVPTTENVANEILRILNHHWPELRSTRHSRLEKIRLEETASNFFEIPNGI